MVNNQQALQIGELWARVVQSKYGGWQGMLEADRAGWESVWWGNLKKGFSEHLNHWCSSIRQAFLY